MIYKVPSIYNKIKNKSATVRVTGSKSITARALVCAALARGVSVLRNISSCGDSRALINCLKGLGVKIRVCGDSAYVEGCGGDFPQKSATLNACSSGSAARFITALCAFSDGEYVVDCSKQMRERPVKPLIESLAAAGAQIFCTDGKFPLKIRGNGLFVKGWRGLKLCTDVTESSQFLSALMLAASAAGSVEIRYAGSHPMQYAEMTAQVIRAFGGKAEKQDGKYTVSGGLSPAEYLIEPDFSSACYFYAANKILGADIKVENLPQNSLQCDAGFINFLKNFNGGEADMSAFPDQTLTLAAIAPFFEKPTFIYGVRHIKKQECDRLNAIQVNLSAMGVPCTVTCDGVKIYPAQPHGALINSFGDHRAAMAFAITGLRAGGVEIAEAESVEKSFGGFFKTLEGVCAELTK